MGHHTAGKKSHASVLRLNDQQKKTSKKKKVCVCVWVRVSRRTLSERVEGCRHTDELMGNLLVMVDSVWISMREPPWPTRCGGPAGVDWTVAIVDIHQSRRVGGGGWGLIGVFFPPVILFIFISSIKMSGDTTKMPQIHCFLTEPPVLTSASWVWFAASEHKDPIAAVRLTGAVWNDLVMLARRLTAVQVSFRWSALTHLQLAPLVHSG